MSMNKFYRHIMDHRDVVENKLSQALVEKSDGIPRDKLLSISTEINRVLGESFSTMIDSLMSIESAESAASSKKETNTKKTARRTRSKK